MAFDSCVNQLPKYLRILQDKLNARLLEDESATLYQRCCCHSNSWGTLMLLHPKLTSA